MIDIIVNGEPKSVDETLSVTGLIESLGLAPKAVVVEYNGSVIKGADLMDKKPAPGDRLELIQIVGGG